MGLRVAYANANYKIYDTRGRSVHIGQFINQAVGLGNEIWSWPGNEHPSVHLLPAARINRLLTLRQMDVIYVRLQENPSYFCRYALNPYKGLLGSPLIVWEFNTIPEFNLVMGRSDNAVRQSIQAFKHYGRGCDLAVCVTNELSEYVNHTLGIKRVLTVPNGSDPELFRPDITPIDLEDGSIDGLNVVWIGSADIAWHNFDLMLKAAEIIWHQERDKNITFHVIGVDGRLKSDQLPPNCHVHGACRYEEIPKWLALMDVGLCLYYPGPADYGSPLKLFDYLASGLAVVATEHPQMRRVFQQLGQLDLLIVPDKPEALVKCLVHLAGDRKRLEVLGRAGRQIVIDYYNWKRAVQDTFDKINVVQRERA